MVDEFGCNRWTSEMNVAVVDWHQRWIWLATCLYRARHYFKYWWWVSSESSRTAHHPTLVESNLHAVWHIYPHRGHTAGLHPTCQGYFHSLYVFWPNGPWSTQRGDFLSTFCPCILKKFIQLMGKILGTANLIRVWWIMQAVTIMGRESSSAFSCIFPQSTAQISHSFPSCLKGTSECLSTGTHEIHAWKWLCKCGNHKSNR